jgi:hypothetical protein
VTATRFTPGPWHVNPMSPLDIYCHHGQVAEASCLNFEEAKDGEHQANAALIATSPELYQLAADLVTLFKPYKAQPDSPEHELLERAQVLVAKGGSK